MKQVLLFLSIATFGCNTFEKKQKDAAINTYDRYIILEYAGDTLVTFSKSEYDSILNHVLPEIVQNQSVHPDSLYFKHAYTTLDFGSEQGRDLFYLIYAKHLSETTNKNIPKKTVYEIEELFYSLNLYMNEIYNLNAGFYHSVQRIPAYTQYELIDYNDKEYLALADKNEKEQFLKLLARQITDKQSMILQTALQDFDKIINSKYKLDKIKSFYTERYEHLIKTR